MNNGKPKEVQDDEDQGMLRESTKISDRQTFSFFLLQFTLNKTENKINDEGYNTAGNGNGLGDHKDAHKKQKRRRILPDRTETKSTTKHSKEKRLQENGRNPKIQLHNNSINNSDYCANNTNN
jgi:hypothetical protein